jgi:hypothetical protein
MFISSPKSLVPTQRPTELARGVARVGAGVAGGAAAPGITVQGAAK